MAQNDGLEDYRNEIRQAGKYTPELEAAAQAYMKTPEYQKKVAEAQAQYNMDVSIQGMMGGSENVPQFNPNDPMGGYAVNPYVKSQGWEGNRQRINYRDDTSVLNAPYDETSPGPFGGGLYDAMPYITAAVMAAQGAIAAPFIMGGAGAAGAGGAAAGGAGAAGAGAGGSGIAAGAGLAGGFEAGATGMAMGTGAGVGAGAAAGAGGIAAGTGLMGGFEAGATGAAMGSGAAIGPGAGAAGIAGGAGLAGGFEAGATGLAMEGGPLMTAADLALTGGSGIAAGSGMGGFEAGATGAAMEGGAVMTAADAALAAKSGLTALQKLRLAQMGVKAVSGLAAAGAGGGGAVPSGGYGSGNYAAGGTGMMDNQLRPPPMKSYIQKQPPKIDLAGLTKEPWTKKWLNQGNFRPYDLA